MLPWRTRSSTRTAEPARGAKTTVAARTAAPLRAATSIGHGDHADDAARPTEDGDRRQAAHEQHRPEPTEREQRPRTRGQRGTGSGTAEPPRRTDCTAYVAIPTREPDLEADVQREEQRDRDERAGAVRPHPRRARRHRPGSACAPQTIAAAKTTASAAPTYAQAHVPTAESERFTSSGDSSAPTPNTKCSALIVVGLVGFGPRRRNVLLPTSTKPIASPSTTNAAHIVASLRDSSTRSSPHGHEHERAGEQPVPVTAVEHPAARDRTDEVSGRLRHEHEADRADARTDLRARGSEARAEHPHDDAEDDERSRGTRPADPERLRRRPALRRERAAEILEEPRDPARVVEVAAETRRSPS